MRCGISPAEFWELTPREIALVARGYGQRLLDALESAIGAAHTGAIYTALASVGKLKPLDELRKRGGPSWIDEEFTTAEFRRWAALKEGAARE